MHQQKSQSHTIQAHFFVGEKSPPMEKGTEENERQGQKNYCNLFGNCPVFSFLLHTHIHTQTQRTRLPPAMARFVHIFLSLTLLLLLLMLLLLRWLFCLLPLPLLPTFFASIPSLLALAVTVRRVVYRKFVSLRRFGGSLVFVFIMLQW